MGGPPDMTAVILVRLLCASGEARRIREDAKLSKAEMGELAGTTGPTVSRWEDGKRKPYGIHAARYHAALVQVRQLVGVARKQVSA